MAGLSLSGLLIATLGARALLDEESYEAELPEPDRAPRAQPAAASVALRGFERAVASGARRGSDLAAPGSEDLVEALLANAAVLNVTDFHARYVDQVGAVETDGSWRAEVDLTWRLAGEGSRPVAVEGVVELAPSGGTVGIVGFGGSTETSGGRTPLWLQGPVSVVHTDRSLVVVAGSEQEAQVVSRRVVRGLRVVGRVLEGWRGRAVVEVPQSAGQLDGLLGSPAGSYAAVAAVTATVDGSGERSAPTHVFVNPDVMRRLRPAGAQVVMSHELTHLATGAAGSRMEPWLLEGFADYVALRGVDLPDTVTLSRALAAVRRSGVPRALPGPAAFDTRSRDLQTAYEQAWLACRVVADELGESALVRVYRAADRGQPVARALAREGLSHRSLLQAWRQRLRDLAASR